MTSAPIEDGDKIRFRAVCGVGWVLSRHLVELRDLCQDLDQDVQWADWVDVIDRELILNYQPSSAPHDVWVADLANRLPTITTGPRNRKRPEVTGFLQKIFAELADPRASLIQEQFEAINDRAYALAGQMLGGDSWSSDEVRARWATTPKMSILISFQPGVKNISPFTDADSGCIKVEVEPKGFDPQHALLKYLTLEVQFLHEYVSHAFPVWRDPFLEEAFLLASTYDFYAISEPRDGIRALLADALDHASPQDPYKRARDQARVFANFVGREEFARFLLSLAITTDSEFSLTHKANLIAKLKRLPLSDATKERACEALFQAQMDRIEKLEGIRAFLRS